MSGGADGPAVRPYQDLAEFHGAFLSGQAFGMRWGAKRSTAFAPLGGTRTSTRTRRREGEKWWCRVQRPRSSSFIPRGRRNVGGRPRARPRPRNRGFHSIAEEEGRARERERRKKEERANSKTWRTLVPPFRPHSTVQHRARRPGIAWPACARDPFSAFLRTPAWLRITCFVWPELLRG